MNTPVSFELAKLLKEKALLLGEEEPTDWEAKYNELKAKYDQLEQKGEKVYFCNTHKGYQIGGLDWAIKNSREQEPIYEAVKLGKKKSVLVKE